MLKRIRELFVGRGKKSPAETASTDPRTPSKPAAAAGSEGTLKRPEVRRGPRVVHRPIPISDLDPDAVKIVKRLTRFDHSAYLVGGCVRDLLLDRKPKDFDVATSATPRQIKRLFRNCRIIGRRFRLAHIYFQNGKIIEVATFRALDEIVPDSGTDDRQDLLIRDDNVFGTPEEDALRRDFTINSLFYDINDETVLDHADGLGDLRRRLIRTIGDPVTRFREDPVRILRALKFAARLDCTIETATEEAIRKTRGELHKSAPPRILEEINRFGKQGAARRSFELMRETGVLDELIPDLARACAERSAAWDLLLDLLDHKDRERVKQEREIRTGEILAALLLPLVFSQFGWSEDGTTTPPERRNPREIIDEHLKPMALGLRVPRREQEHCRQVLATLYRMVPSHRVRRNTKRSVLGRESFADALWILGVVAARFEGEFAKSFDFWKRGDEAREKDDKPAKPAGSGDSPRGRSRGRRRGGRRRSGRGKGAPAQETSAKPAESASKGKATPRKTDKKDGSPRKWDDDYFFAALPTAPEGVGDEADGQRYPAPGTVEKVESRESEAEEAKPAKKRRPRRRRRRRNPSGPKEGSGGKDQGPD